MAPMSRGDNCLFFVGGVGKGGKKGRKQIFYFHEEWGFYF